MINDIMHTACIDCSKYAAGDQLGHTLALICHSAYLSIFYLASVNFLLARQLQNRKEVFLHIPAIAFATAERRAGALQVVYSKKDLQDGAILSGAIVNAGIGKALKSAWRQPRPSAK